MKIIFQIFIAFIRPLREKWSHSKVSGSLKRFTINPPMSDLHSISYKGTYPSVVMVTMVYQKAAGMLVNLLADDPFSA